MQSGLLRQGSGPNCAPIWKRWCFPYSREKSLCASPSEDLRTNENAKKSWMRLQTILAIKMDTRTHVCMSDRRWACFAANMTELRRIALFLIIELRFGLTKPRIAISLFHVWGFWIGLRHRIINFFFVLLHIYNICCLERSFILDHHTISLCRWSKIITYPKAYCDNTPSAFASPDAFYLAKQWPVKEGPFRRREDWGESIWDGQTCSRWRSCSGYLRRKLYKKGCEVPRISCLVFVCAKKVFPVPNCLCFRSSEREAL